MSQDAKAQQIFQAELSFIKSDAIRNFVLQVFDTLGHDAFWPRVCSMSGKYHPYLAQFDGGLVRHVKYGVWWALELCRSRLGEGKRDGSSPKKAFTPEEQAIVDCVIASLILHDLLKDGDPTRAHEPERVGGRGKAYICGCHGVDLAQAIWNRVLGRKGTPEQILILYAIAGHMGHWTVPAEYQPTKIQNDLARFVATLVADADYAASRKADDYMLAVLIQNGMIERYLAGYGYQLVRPQQPLAMPSTAA